MAHHVLSIVESKPFRVVVMIAVIANALVLGLATYDGLPAGVRVAIESCDRVFLGVFVAELALKLWAYGRRFFANAWNIFDLAVVLISIIATGPLSVLRAFRVLRMLRLVSVMPALRRVVEALVRSVPGIGAITGVMAVFFYVGGVVATNLYGAEHAMHFGDLGASTLTLFQLMLFDGWADVVREVNATHPGAWAFFVFFTIVSAFAVLNLFIAVMVDALREEHDALQDVEIERLEEGQELARREREAVLNAVRALETRMETLIDARLGRPGERVD